MNKLGTKNKNNIQKTVQKYVSAAFREILSDPDAGSVLTSYAENRLKKSVNSAKKGKVKSFSEVFRKYKV